MNHQTLPIQMTDEMNFQLSEGGFNIGTAETAIFPIILGNHNLVLNGTRMMGAKWVLAVGVPYPAVARKKTRIRMIVTSKMTKAHLDKGYEALCNAINQSRHESLQIL